MTRRVLLGGLASLPVLAAAAPAMASAPAVLRGAGQFHKLAMVNDRTGEWLNTVYWADGTYIPEALGALNHILRDWREDKVHKMDPGVLDILAATHRLLETDEPFTIVSGYRTPKTNAMLRRHSSGVAKNSYHIKGMAIDVTLKSRTVEQISRAGLSLNGGGVGRYTSSDFVHLDCGPVRTWGS
jgi:uncharacterized protein YcbK (DUF882 family)